VIRFQVEAFIGGIVNSEAAHQAGQKVAIQTREVQTIYRTVHAGGFLYPPLVSVGDLIYQASDDTVDKKCCVDMGATHSHLSGTFGSEEARVIGDLLKEHFVDTKVARIIKVYVTVFTSPESHSDTYTEVVTYQIDPSKWTPRSHGVTTTTYKIPTLGLED
jgi:hypothetical protein